ncbi:MAG: class I SAM-dependent methyltransferase [Pyrinomonadaceae bacterium]
MAKQERYSDYDSFAWFYDRYWSREVPPQIMTVVDRLLVPSLPRGATVLDLCCGTGYTCAELIKRGFEVIGLDGSKEMLRRARRHAPGARFMLADARSFTLPPVHQGVVSTFDSLNHVMSIEELTNVFRNAHGALAPAGHFLFDMNMEKGFLQHWVDCFAIVEDDAACVLRGTYDSGQRIGRYDVTMFRRAEGKAWRRTDAKLSERCYTSKEIKRALRTVGFKEIRTFDAERELGLTEHLGRTFFLARR